MDKAHPLSSPMVVRSFDVKNDQFRPCEKGEELLGPEVPYLSVIGALMYLANYIRPDSVFSVNLLARYSSAPTKRHWKGIQHILRYLNGTTDMGLFYLNKSKENYSDMQMQDIFQILIELYHKPGMFLTTMELLSHGDLSSRQWWLHHQIIQKLLQFTKLVVNAYGLDR